MSLMLPDWLEWVLEMLGYDWPTGDEDKMNESADHWRTFASAVEQLQSEGVSAAGNVLSANSGDSIDGFSKTWEKYSGNGSGYLDDARSAAELIAFALDSGSVVIIGMKVAVIAQLAILAAEIIAAQAAAPFTLGLSEIGAAAATQATRLIVRRILKEAREALVEAIVETVKEPAVSALEAMVSDAIAQGMNMHFGAQQGFDVGRSAKTGAEAGVEALKNSGQTFAESLRDGAGGRAGHHARDGLEHAAGRGGSEDSGGDGGGTSESSGSGTGSNSGSGSNSGAGSNSGSGSGGGDGAGSGSGSGAGSGSGSGSGSSAGSGSGSGSGADGGGAGTDSGSGAGSGTGSGSGSGSGAGSGESSGSGNGSGGGNSSGGPSHAPRAGDSGTGTGSGSGPSATGDSSTPGPDGNRNTPQAQPLPPPDQRTAFDEGYTGGNNHNPYGGSTPGPDSGSTTPDSGGPGPDSGTTPDSGSPTPDAARPDSDSDSASTRPTPDAISTQPAPDNTPDAARPDAISTQPTPDHTPDSARPDPDSLSTQPAPGPSVHPDGAPAPDSGTTTPDAAPAPDHSSAGPSNSPTPDGSSHPDASQQPQQASPSPDPVAGNPPTNTDNSPQGDSNSGQSGSQNNGDNSASGAGGRPSTPHVGVPSQGAPVHHSSSGPPIGQRDPSPGDPMPHVRDEDTTVTTQSAGTMTAPPPTPHTADPSTATPSTPQQSPQNTPQNPGPMTGPPTAVPPQGGPATPHSAPPRGSTPSTGNASAPSNRRPDGSQAIHDATQQRRPEPPPYNSRLDGPRPTTTSPGPNRRPDGSQAIHDATQQRRPEPPPYNPRLDGPRPDQDRQNQQHPQGSQPPHGQNPAPQTNQPNQPNQQGPRPDQTQPVRPDQTQPVRPDQAPPRPDQTQPVRPDQQHPQNQRPDTTRPDTPRPDATRPDQPRPDAPRPDATRPDDPRTPQNGQSDPRQQRPDQAQPRPDTPRPDAQRPPQQQPHDPNQQRPQQQPQQQPHRADPRQQQPEHQPTNQPNRPDPRQQPTLQSHQPQSQPHPQSQSTNHQQPQHQNQPQTQQQQPNQQPQHQAPPQPHNQHQNQNQQPQHHQPQPPHQQQQPTAPNHPPRPSLNDVRASLNHQPSGLYSPFPHDQQALENNFPRNPDGSPQRHADPFQPWSQLQNDGGPTVPGRSNNCADCTRSFMESWYGNPQVSAPRTYDNDGHGGLDRVSGERDGTNNIQNWAGTNFRHSGQNAQDSYQRIADELRQSGHGSAAAVLVTWPKNPDGSGGGAHVFNAVNHNGRVVWVDSQTGQISQQPIHTHADGVWHLTLDADRKPFDPAANQQQGQGQGHSQGQGQGQHQGQHQNPQTQQPGPHQSQNQGQPQSQPQPQNPQHPPQNAPGPHPAGTPRDGTAEDGTTSDASSGRPDHHSPGDPPPSHRTPHNGTPDNGTPDHQPPAQHTTQHTADNPPAADRRPPENPSGQDTPQPPSDPSGTKRPAEDEIEQGDSKHPRTDTETDGPEPGGAHGDGHPAPSPMDIDSPEQQTGSDPHSAENTREERNSDLPEPERTTDHHASLPPDSEQQGIRVDPDHPDAPHPHPVYRIGLDPVHDRMQHWANDGSLADLLQRAADRKAAADAARANNKQDGNDPVDIPPTAFTERELREVLGKDFAEMNDGQRGAVVATLARMSQAFHEDNGVGQSPQRATDGENPYHGAPPRKKDGKPDPIEQNEVSAGAHSREQAKPAGSWPETYRQPGTPEHQALTDLRDARRPNLAGRDLTTAHVNQLLRQAGSTRPDFTGKNYAVIEVVDSEGNSTYVVDSSIPAGNSGYTPRHSERHLLEWVERLNKSQTASGQGTYDIAGLYTEREPCGEGLGHAHCTTEIQKRPPFPVYYSTTYRTDPDGQPARDEERARLQQERRDLLASMEGQSEAAQKAALRKAELSDSKIDERVKAHRQPNEQIMDEEMDNHLRKMGHLWATTRMHMLPKP
ncbi:toxin glutamine deamidase domain-containing protein [Streptomyces nigrescens]|uniref:toxin glutamine deamidase domain-containing protein n=1 Tax=Streptomyces nigrescens TaxID=1920 RepID=UPI00381AD301